VEAKAVAALHERDERSVPPRVSLSSCVTKDECVSSVNETTNASDGLTLEDQGWIHGEEGNEQLIDQTLVVPPGVGRDVNVVPSQPKFVGLGPDDKIGNLSRRSASDLRESTITVVVIPVNFIVRFRVVKRYKQTAVDTAVSN